MSNLSAHILQLNKKISRFPNVLTSFESHVWSCWTSLKLYCKCSKFINKLLPQKYTKFEFQFLMGVNKPNCVAKMSINIEFDMQKVEFLVKRHSQIVLELVFEGICMSIIQ